MIAPLVVYDTMVFLQAAISPNRRYATFDAVEDNRLSLCLSVELAAEVRDVLTRPVQTRRFPALTPQRVAQFLDKVNALATLFHDVPPIFDWPQHPDDNHVFNLAIRARAKYLVTWETRILKLANDSSAAAESLRRLAPDLVIITPKQLADLLRQPE